MKNVLMIAGGALVAFWYLQRNAAPTGTAPQQTVAGTAAPLAPSGTSTGTSAPTQTASSAPAVSVAGVAPPASSGKPGGPVLGLDAGSGTTGAPQVDSPAPFAFERMDFVHTGQVRSPAREMAR